MIDERIFLDSQYVLFSISCAFYVVFFFNRLVIHLSMLLSLFTVYIRYSGNRRNVIGLFGPLPLLLPLLPAQTVLIVSLRPFVEVRDVLVCDLSACHLSQRNVKLHQFVWVERCVYAWFHLPCREMSSIMLAAFRAPAGIHKINHIRETAALIGFLFCLALHSGRFCPHQTRGLCFCGVPVFLKLTYEWNSSIFRNQVF